MRWPAARYRNGEETLRAFAGISATARHSIVKFNVDGCTVALGTVVDTNGLVLTKASELKRCKLTCWLATEQEAGAVVLATDEAEDLALVRVEARGLKPVSWAGRPAAVGQWVVTPGIAETPHAVGIVSAVPRRIRYQRALMGVQLDSGTLQPRIAELMTGLGAEKAGLKPGDVILSVNDGSVTNREQVSEKLRDFHDGQVVKVRVQRSGSQIEATVKLTAIGAAIGAERFDPFSVSVSQRAEGFERVIEHDSVLAPWLCGGPLMNLDGEAMGINIARASRVTTFALSAGLVQRALERLRPGAAGRK